MLILRRKKNESILIGDNIRITLLECASDGVRIAIDAPKQISIIREELSEAERINKEAISPGSVSVRSLQVAMANYIKSSANSENKTDSDDVLNMNA
ncbi:MAG: carbon storage regulator [Lachnospiraceae bacterium]|nr:carbon storage regulator [Lachnospiraceae bacterium]